MARAFISVGANIDPEVHVRHALRLLARQARITSISTFYRNAAVGGHPQPPFINGMVEVATDATPDTVKCEVLRRIEERLGRVRTADKYAPRTIDLDLVLYDGRPLAGVAIIHCAYIAVPLAELAPDLVLPDTHVAVVRVAAALGRQALEPLPAFTASLREEIAHGYSKSRADDPGTAR